MKKLVLAVFGISLVCTVHLQAQSSPITVNNPSFETAGRVDGGYFPDGLFTTFFGTIQWNATRLIGNTGIWNPQNAQYTGATDSINGVQESEIGGPGVPDGVHMGHMSGTQSGSFWQKTARTLEPFDYTLQVKLGHEIGVPQAGAAIRVRLGDSVDGNNDLNGTILKSLSIPANTVPSDSFQTFTLNITKAESAAFLPANQGKNLVIELFGDMSTFVSGVPGRADWDVVEFSYIPEPTSVALLAWGGLVLLRRRAR